MMLATKTNRRNRNRSLPTDFDLGKFNIHRRGTDKAIHCPCLVGIERNVAQGVDSQKKAA
jgi:hypothetical protein